jgi:hypothetical protein
MAEFQGFKVMPRNLFPLKKKKNPYEYKIYEIAGRISDGSNGDVAIDQYHRYMVWLVHIIKEKQYHNLICLIIQPN